MINQDDEINMIFADSLKSLEECYNNIIAEQDKSSCNHQLQQTFKFLSEAGCLAQDKNNDFSLEPWGYIPLIVEKISIVLPQLRELGLQSLENPDFIAVTEEIYNLIFDILCSQSLEKVHPEQYRALCQKFELAEDFSVVNFFNEEGWIIYDSITEIDNVLKNITSLKNFDKIKLFLDDLSQISTADISIILIASSKDLQEQVYAWVVQLASKYPEINIRIDLFDKINNYNIEDKLEIVVQDDNWLQNTELKMRFMHKKHTNLVMNVSNIYLPLEDYTSMFSRNIESLLLTAVEKLLEIDKVVIFAEHLLGNIIDPIVTKIFNQVNMYEFFNAHNLFVVVQNHQMLDKRFYIYNQTTIDHLVHHYIELHPEKNIGQLEKTLLSNLEKVSYNISGLEFIIPDTRALYNKYLVWSYNERYHTDTPLSNENPIKEYLISFQSKCVKLSLEEFNLEMHEVVTNKHLVKPSI